MSGVVELIDQAVDLPPGPQLSAALAQLPWAEIPNARLVEVLQAHSRQLAHAQAGLFAGMAEIARATPVAGLPDGALARTAEDVEWAAHEIAAALTWTPTTADRELELALVLVRGLPWVFAALEQGLIDRGKAKVFADLLDPARGELTPTQIRRLCERFVPLAPGWTARQLSRRLLAAIQVIDPEFHRRRYRRGLRGRAVALHLNRDGTATLSAEGLPPDEAAAAAARLDRLAEAARRAGHPARLPQITADLYLGMLDGSFHGLTEAQILARLLTRLRPEDSTHTDTVDTDGAERGGETTSTEAVAGTTEANADDRAPIHSNADRPTDTDRSDTDPSDTGAGVGSTNAASTATDDTSPGEANAREESAGQESADSFSVGGKPAGNHPTGQGLTGAGPPDKGSAGTGEGHWRGERIGLREGIELRVGLATLLGCDQRPGEIPGLGPIDAHLARTTVARQRRGAQWQFAIVDTRGYLLLAGPLRRRPRKDRPTTSPPGTSPPDRVHGGVVELHLTLTELYRFAADPDLTADWAGIIAEIADHWADRHRLWHQLTNNPRTRYARGALARHVRTRDGTCVGPCCDRSARRSDLDHTRDHTRGGNTVDTNIGPTCWRHHPDKNRGWILTQPRPGHFIWISPLGRTYRTRGEPIRPDLPEPDPPPEGTNPRDDPDPEQGNPLDPGTAEPEP